MSNLLVDTPVLLWALGSPDSLKPETQQVLVDPDNEVFVSAATSWEISIKAALGKLRAPSDLEQQVRRLRFRPLPISFAHGLAVRDLPMLHRDPFDRMLITQARAHGLVLVTRDEKISQYDVVTMDA